MRKYALKSVTQFPTKAILQREPTANVGVNYKIKDSRKKYTKKKPFLAKYLAEVLCLLRLEALF